MNNNKTKILAMYLPQYHEIPENSTFWGKGFTDWVTVKKAEPLFEGHKQPIVPLNKNYYDLSEKENIAWQVELAKKYGIHAFGIYHYWFSTEKVVLTKPAEILLESKELDINFFFAWDNTSWKRTWSKVKGNDWAPTMDVNKQESNEPKTLIEYKLGEEEDWKVHFDYLLPYFKDERYMKKDGKPVFVIYNYAQELIPMQEYWDTLAKENGFEGIEMIYRYDPLKVFKKCNSFSYEPLYSGWGATMQRIASKASKLIGEEKVGKYSYDKVWEKLLKNARDNKQSNHYHGAFVNYDDTPRRGNRGKIIENGTPEKFEKYLSELLRLCNEQEKEYIFLTAWNEWGEGAYLEPNQDTKYAYLEAVFNALSKTDNLQ